MISRDFISDLRQFTAISAVAVSALRNQGQGTIRRVRTILGKLDLTTALKLQTPDDFAGWLDATTLSVIRATSAQWGASRKAVNLFLRASLYNKYLNASFDLDRLQYWMEIPLDKVVATYLTEQADRKQLPVWRGLKKLTEDDSASFQKYAMRLAEDRAIARVHLDVSIWVHRR